MRRLRDSGAYDLVVAECRALGVAVEDVFDPTTAPQHAARRAAGARLVASGITRGAVARLFGVTWPSARDWVEHPSPTPRPRRIAPPVSRPRARTVTATLAELKAINARRLVGAGSQP